MKFTPHNSQHQPTMIFINQTVEKVGVHEYSPKNHTLNLTSGSNFVCRRCELLLLKFLIRRINAINPNSQPIKEFAHALIKHFYN